MKRKPEHKAFSMPIDDLLVLADEKIAYARRIEDAEAFTNRGWTDERITALEDKFKEVGKLPTDDELEQEVRAAEQKKNDYRVATTTKIQTVLGKIRQVHDDESPEYRAYGSAKVHESGDPAFALLCEQISRVGQRALAAATDEEKAEYTAAGLAPADFIEIGAAGDEFRRLIVDVRSAEARRDIGTQARIRAANGPYRELSELCDVGKNIYISSDEARYNDYVIYDEPAADAPAAPVAPAGPTV